MNIKIAIIASLLVLLASCASTPPSAKLIQAESEYNSAGMLSGIHNAAAPEMSNAKEALEKAKQLQDDNSDKNLIDHYATVSIKNTEIAQERLRLKQIEQEIEKADEKRHALLLQAKSKEANLAKLKAIQLATELDELQAKQSERGITFTLEDIVFAFDSANLKPGGERTVARIAQYLNEYPDRDVLIEGFTDSVGSEEYNLKLSRQRAEAVKQSLIQNGVNYRRLTTQGMGEAFPVASNSTDAGRQQNRRVEIIILNEKSPDVLGR